MSTRNKPMSIFETQDFLALKDYWYNRLKEVGFKDIENKDGSLKDSGMNVYLGEYEAGFIDELSDKYKYVKDEVEDYYDQVSVISKNHRFTNETHKMVFALRSEGITEEEIGLTVGLSQQQVSYILEQYLYPDKEVLKSKARMMLSIQYNLFTCLDHKVLISNTLANRSVEKSAKELNLGLSVAKDIIQHYKTFEGLPQNPLLNYYLTEYPIPSRDTIYYSVQYYLKHGNIRSASKDSGIPEATVSSAIKEAYSIAVDHLSNKIKEV